MEFSLLSVNLHTDGMCLVEIYICAVLLFKCDDFGKIANGPLHRVDTLDDDQNLSVRSTGQWISISDRVAKDIFQTTHI